MDKELPLLAALSGPADLPEYLIARCRNKTDAVQLCWHMRRVKYGVREAARLLGIPTSHLSNIIAGKKYLPHNDVEFMRLCGNLAIKQWEDRELGYYSVLDTPEQREIRRLRSELDAVRAAA
jgi:hypothetical protein